MNPPAFTRKLAGNARTFALRIASGVASIAGRHCLDRQDTVRKLAGLDAAPDANGLFTLDTENIRIDVLSCGVLRLNGRDCLDIDYGARGALRGWSGPCTKLKQAAVLWSHQWNGYYHWLIDIAPKITAIQALPDGRNTTWLFPRSYQRYEMETLDLLGINSSEIIDTHGFRSIGVSRIHAIMLPGWFNIQKSAALLRERLLPSAGPGTGEKIYLKRRGRRRCLNENEVVRHLTHKGFVMVEDEPRSVTEQIGIFSKAKLIVTPHGAALANLLWCSPICTVIECFAEGYCPPYYRNLASFVGMRYASIGDSTYSHWTGVAGDIYINLRELDACLEKLGTS